MQITVETTVDAPAARVWAAWTQPADIVAWNFASDDWRCPRAEIELTAGGRFRYRMEARDGSMGFDLEGTFTAIEPHTKIEYVLEDGRNVSVEFVEAERGITIIETFEAENEFSAEQQRQGWQSILENFRKHVEASSPG